MRSGGAGGRWAVAALAVVAVLLRVPFLTAAEGSDEGGYLTIARQWHPGPSLYGHYWVDRPPLLLTLFQAGSVVGGLPGLRLLGALAAGVAVLGVAAVARKVAGPRAAVCTAAVAAVLYASPLMGAVQVNGELLAAPFVAWSIALGVDVIRTPGPARVGRSAFGAGALAVAALLVKQNMVEPFVFLAVAGVVAGAGSWRRGVRSAARVRRTALAAAGGGLVALAVVGAWTLAHGTSLGGVFDAMYPFRIRAAALLATVPDPERGRRAHAMLSALLASGTVVLVALFGWSLLRRRLRGPAVWGLAAALAYSVVSILLAGGYWDHYLVEPVGTLAIVAGLLVGDHRRDATRDATRDDLRDDPGRARLLARVLPVLATAYVVGAALVHWGGGLEARASARGEGVGTAVAAVAAPGDTIVSAVGNAETVESSGLSSPYPYLWTLPAQVEDPRLALLDRLLVGPARPTWFVGWDRPSFPSPVTQWLDAVVRAHYRLVGQVCGQPVHLRDDVVRPPPDPATPCTRAPTLLP